MYPDVLKNMNLYVDGNGYAGAIEEITLPKVAAKTEEFRAGGMDAPIDVEVGMEKLETQFTLRKFDKDVLKQFGIKNSGKLVATIRGSFCSEENGEEFPVVINLKGLITEIDFGNWKSGENAMLKVAMSLRSYKLTVDGEEVYEIDIPAMIKKVNGVDEMSETRSNIGL